MRLGEILVESGQISLKQLASGLAYASGKPMPIGRVLVLLHFIGEDKLKPALAAQTVIRKGFDPQLCMQALKLSYQFGVAFEKSLESVCMTPEQKRLVQGLSSQKTTTVEIKKQKYGNLTAKELVGRADFLLNEDRMAEAEECYLLARARLEEELGTRNPEVAAVVRRLAHLYLANKRFAEAEGLYLFILDIRQAASGGTVGGELALADAWDDLCDCYLPQKEWEQAATCLAQSWKLRQKHLPESWEAILSMIRRYVHLSTGLPYPQVKLKVGELLVAADLMDQEQLREALKQSSLTGKTLGKVFSEQGIVGEQGMKAALAIQFLLREGRVPFEESCLILRLVSRNKINLKQYLDHQGVAFEGANAKLISQKNILLELDNLLACEFSRGADHPDCARAGLRLAAHYLLRGDTLDAEILYKRAVSIIEKNPNSFDMSIKIDAYDALSRIFCEAERYFEARPLLKKLADLLNKSNLPAKSFTCFWALARIEKVRRNNKEAFCWLNQALEIYLRDEAEHQFSLDEIRWLGSCLLEAEVTPQMETLWPQVLSRFEKESNLPVDELAVLYEGLADCMLSCKNYSEAIGYLEKSAEIYSRVPDLIIKLGSVLNKLEESRKQDVQAGRC